MADLPPRHPRPKDLSTIATARKRCQTEQKNFSFSPASTPRTDNANYSWRSQRGCRCLFLTGICSKAATPLTRRTGRSPWRRRHASTAAARRTSGTTGSRSRSWTSGWRWRACGWQRTNTPRRSRRWVLIASRGRSEAMLHLDHPCVLQMSGDNDHILQNLVEHLRVRSGVLVPDGVLQHQRQ